MGQGPKLPKNPALEWLQEGPSVMDAAWEAPIKGILGLMGADDPNSGLMEPPVMEASSQIAAPLISRFKDVLGVPSKAVRDSALTKHLNELYEKAPSQIYDAYASFADRYPRVASHMRIATSPAPNDMMKSNLLGGEIASAHIRTDMLDKGERMLVEYADKTLGQDKNSLRGTMFHEGTHAAQKLGNKDFRELYDSATNLVGYYENPFEVTARLRGEAAQQGKYHTNQVRVPRTTDKVIKQEEAIRKLKWPWDGGEHKALMNDMLYNAQQEAGKEAYTAMRGLRNITLRPERYHNPSVSGNRIPLDKLFGAPDALKGIQDTLKRRGAFEIPEHPKIDFKDIGKAPRDRAAGRALQEQAEELNRSLRNIAAGSPEEVDVMKQLSMIHRQLERLR